jgi:hypothetical protein
MFKDLGQDCQGLWNCWRNGQWCSKIDSVSGSAQEPLNWEDTEEHDAPPSPNRQVPPFAGNSSQVSKTPPTLRSAACKKPGVDGKPPQKYFLKIFPRETQMVQLKRWAD